ncbi:MAG: copper-translocating P-type ATPase [Leptolyngbyaceae cyanobacterium T60_A2020_046]|nr:copper-translocating P-type ATPase [Leptolyngbyaceae cyanobacterium T60_A2020_046]
MVNVAPHSSTAAPDAASSPTPAIVLDVSGMKCAGCVRAVERQLTAYEGVAAATVNLVTEVAVVQAAAGATLDPSVLANRLTESGFPSQPRSRTDAAGAIAGLSDWVDRKRQENRDQVQRLAIALILFVLSTIGHLKHFGWVTIPVLSDLWFHFGLATVALVGPGRAILVEGWQGARHGAPNMNTLVGLGTLSAYLASVVALLWPGLGWECFFDEPVMLLSFILLGRTLEQRARFQATDALRSLMALQPAMARLIANPDRATATQPGVEIPAECVQPGEWVQVRPGETVPADGVIVDGQTTLDESMLTGESLPTVKQLGDEVSAGTVNQTGAIAVRVTRVGGDTVLAQMICLVETAQTRKAPIQRLADVISGYFTYGVLTLAALTFSFWYWVGLDRWPDVLHSALGSVHHSHVMTAQSSALLVSLKLAIAVLVVACPCALGLATPTAILVGSGLGARRGLLIRGGDVLEGLHTLDTIVFDKTGTLTLGQPQVVACQPLTGEVDGDDLLAIAAAVECGTQHPLAIAIQHAAQRRKLTLPAAHTFETQVGLGVAATVTWHNQAQRVWVGNARALDTQAIPLPSAAQAWMAALATDQTGVFVAISDHVVGAIAVADTLRPDAVTTVARLKEHGIAVHLLTGDRAPVAAAIAAAVGIPADQVQAEVLPADKSTAIAQLQAAGRRVALVGDGINDAPALALADVGISLSSGTDIAAEAADVVLMGDRLSNILTALELGHATVSKIRQNLTWAFAYNLLGIPAAAGVLLPAYGLSLSPAIAGGLMAFSSVTVVVNSLLLRLPASHSA